MTYTIDIRQRRQATFPNPILKALGLSIGDSVQIKVEGDRAILTPKKNIALNALTEIQEAFKESKVPMDELTKNAEEQRLKKAKSYT